MYYKCVFFFPTLIVKFKMQKYKIEKIYIFTFLFTLVYSRRNVYVQDVDSQEKKDLFS